MSEEKPLVYRLVRAIYDAREERGFQNVGLDLCNAENFTLSVGPNPGGDEFSFLISATYCGLDRSHPQQLHFTFDDDLPARQLAQALTAWADWTEEQRANDPEYPESSSPQENTNG